MSSVSERDARSAKLEGRLHRYRIATVTLGLISLALIAVSYLLATTNFAHMAENNPMSAPEVPVQGNPGAVIIGEPGASVTLVAWTDVQCAHCAAFSQHTLPVLIDEYVTDGRVNIHMYNIAAFGDDSERAAAAAGAANEQGRYLEYLAQLHRSAAPPGVERFTRESLIDAARSAGVADLQEFAADLDDHSSARAIRDNTDAARAAGVTSLPFFAVGDRHLRGNLPLNDFRKLLDDALANG